MKTRNASELNDIVDRAEEAVRALADLGCPIDQYGNWLVHCIVRKLDANTREAWEISQENKSGFPTYGDLLRFLERRLQSLEQARASAENKEFSSTARGSQKNKLKQVSANSTHALDTKQSAATCIMCKGNHALYACQKFTSMSHQQKFEFCKKEKLCLNCLQRSHFLDSCPSSKRCLVCKRKHHTKLHYEPAASQKSQTVRSSKETVHSPSSENHEPRENTQDSTVAVNAVSIGKAILLATANIVLADERGNTMKVRALIDPAAERSFVSERILKYFATECKKVAISVIGVGAEAALKARGEAVFSVRSELDGGFNLPLVALVLKELTRFLPHRRVEHSKWSHLRGIQLADPAFFEPRVDCILGADVYAQILLDGIIRGPAGTPLAQNTVFGWVLTGSTNSNSKSDQQSAVRAYHVQTEPTISQLLVKFWEIEEVPRKTVLSPEEQFCEEYFSKTVTRDAQGRFVVRLPFSKKTSFIDSRDIAIACLIRSENRRKRQPLIDQAYRIFMQEYIDLGHMEPVGSNVRVENSFYMPHHAVFSQEINKIRVVFNASQRGGSGVSLNDLLLPGPKLQTDISIVLSYWRLKKFVFVTDIQKMFRQILVHRDDTDWQRIVWRPNPASCIQDYRAVTVTYGTVSAPYLAIRTLLQLAEEGKTTHPEAACILRHQIYVDDIFSGGDDLMSATKRRDQLVQLLASAGMALGKWSANDPALLRGLSAESNNEVPVKLEEVVSTLGLKWLPNKDVFVFKLSQCPRSTIVTKRSVLSDIAKLFDPLGWLAPIIITAKVILQDLWLDKLEWNQPVRDELSHRWLKFRDSLEEITQIEIPRWLGFVETTMWHLHGFSDASKRAYAAAIYAVNPGGTSHLLIAKTKIAPTRVETLPRLELCGAVLLVRLAKHLLSHHFPQPEQVHFWTDSQIVLEWMKSHPSRWQTFVANRTSEIISSFPSAIWRHVGSADNPVDCATRGSTPSQLSKASLWWTGPQWISQPPSHWPSSSSQEATAREVQTFVAREENSPKHSGKRSDVESECLPTLQKFSNFSKILRILAYCLRWRFNTQQAEGHRQTGPLSAKEWTAAKVALFRAIQLAHYAKERKCLLKGRALSSHSSMIRMTPFICNQGLIRVGGRMQNAALTFNEKHPVILPGNSAFVRRLVEEAHSITLHGGVGLMMSFLNGSVWITRGRHLATGVYRRCVRCARYSGRTVHQQMAPLPKCRVSPNRPFAVTGLDYAGPFPVLFSRGRGAKTTKAYVAIFVCVVVKAVHVEIVSDLTTDAFLAAYARFTARRGACSVIYSDNARTFVGAAGELRKLFEKGSPFSKEMGETLALRGTTWSFIPPRAPHFGGLWEAAVRSFKYHFVRTLGHAILTFEELSTLGAKIEACLNSRPLCPLSNEATDAVALTPGHFLVGVAPLSLPEPMLDLTARVHLSKRWQLLNELQNSFWTRWKKEVLNQLQQRNKWFHPQPNMKKGDLVILRDELTPPTKWPLALVLDLHRGRDGLVRVVTIKTASSTLVRPVVKLIKLPCEEEAESYYGHFHQAATSSG